MMSLMTRVADAHFRKDPNGRVVFIPFTAGGSATSLTRKLTKRKSERLSTCTGFLTS